MFRTTRSQQHQNPRKGKGGSRQKEEGSSSSSSLWKQQLYLLAVSITGLSFWYLTPLSEIVVDTLLQEIPIEADIELGNEALRDNFPFPTIHHPRYTPLLQQVGWELVSSSSSSSSLSFPFSTQEYRWDFGVIDTRRTDPHMINAFALPGGTIRVTQALLDTLQLTQGELAALLGHEMGHVLHRHSQARMLERRILSTVARALVYDDGDAHQESFGEAMGELLLQSADWLGQQSFSRRNEYQADATSWDLLVSSSSFHPLALQSLLQKLYQTSGGQGGTTSWESTHPGTLDWIQALDQKWSDLPASERRRLEQYGIR